MKTIFPLAVSFCAFVLHVSVTAQSDPGKTDHPSFKNTQANSIRGKTPHSGPGRDINTVYITADGKVGIGVSAPVNKLSVDGDIHVTDSILVEGGRLVTGDFRGATLNGVINCGGAYRTYTNTLSDLVDPLPDYAVGDEDLYIQDILEVGTQAYKPGGGSWATLSDSRFKRNIEPFTDGLAKVMQIRPVSFQYNERASLTDANRRYIGVLAQDMIAIAPYMVEEVSLGQVVREVENGVDEVLEPGTPGYTFDPSALDYIMINAIQELEHKIEAQNRRIAALEEENVLLKVDAVNPKR